MDNDSNCTEKFGKLLDPKMRTPEGWRDEGAFTKFYDEISESCTCPSCVSSCKYRVGWLHPKEAVHLIRKGLSYHLMVDYYIKENGHSIYILAPAKLGCEGQLCDSCPEGICTFLKDDRCTIYKDRPIHCRVSQHNCPPHEYMDLHTRVLPSLWESLEG